MIFLKGLLEADDSDKGKNKAALEKPTKPQYTDAPATKPKEPKPATMNTTQAGGGMPRTAGTSDIQKQNGQKTLVAPVKGSAEREANSLDQPGEAKAPVNPNIPKPASHLVGRPIVAQKLNEIIPPNIDAHGFIKTFIPGEQVQICNPPEFSTFVNEPEQPKEPELQEGKTIDVSGPIERDMIIPHNEIESFLRAFHIGKNITLPITEFSKNRTIKCPWPNMNDTVAVIVRLSPTKDGQIEGIEHNGNIIRPEGPEARCIWVSKLLCPRQNQNTIHCLYVIDLEERMSEDGPLAPIKEGKKDDKIVNPVFDKYMSGPLRQQTDKDIKLKDTLPKNIKDDTDI